MIRAVSSIKVLSYDSNEKHKKYFSLRIKFQGKLLQKQEYDAGRAKGEWEYWSIRERFEEKRAQMVLKEEEFRML